ncbi:hypothetical protein D3C79_959210 [compost metagenome]
MAVGPNENADTPYRTAILLQLHRIDFGVIENRADDLGTVLHAGVRGPPGPGADAVVLGIFVQVRGICVLPRAQQQSFCFKLHILDSSWVGSG